MENLDRNKEIYAKHKWGLTVREIAVLYKISSSAVGVIIKREEKREKLAKRWGNLPTRTINALKKSGFKSLEQAKQAKDEFLLAIPNIGNDALEQIRQAV